MAYTKAGMRAVDRYVKANYDSFLVRVPKGRKADVEQFAQDKGQSVNGLVNGLLAAEMDMSAEEWKEGGLNTVSPQ